MVIHLFLLPALPKALSSGSVRGLLAKGDLRIDMDWEDGKVTSLSIKGAEGRQIILH